MVDEQLLRVMQGIYSSTHQQQHPEDTSLASLLSVTMTSFVVLRLAETALPAYNQRHRQPTAGQTLTNMDRSS